MTLDELRRLDPKKIAAGRYCPAGSPVGAALLIVGASYWFDWQPARTAHRRRTEGSPAQGDLSGQEKGGYQLPVYRKQLDDIEKQFGRYSAVAGQSEMETLLTDINQAGLGRGFSSSCSSQQA
jgi:type IV pilus assembly protein PilO